MECSPSPRPLALRNPPKPDRVLSPTPPPHPQSKRDKRRTALSDRLVEINESFSQNQDTHYRQQLQALQIDMGLIVRARPYAENSLEDSAETVEGLVTAATGGSTKGPGMNHLNGHRRQESEIAALAGKVYAAFLEEVNDAMEQRDADLVLLQRKHERTLHELHTTNRYKLRLALEEHRQLSNTLRERLIQSIGTKKSRLMREKEQLDIADSNALLLHPNQFSITNPASPAGMQGNRKTRHTRLREVDELAGGFSADGSHKRKRKITYEENDLGSPSPAVRAMDTGLVSPFKSAQARMTATQHEAPIYSIDKLFTEKELAMHLNTAAVAASRYFVALKAQEDAATNGVNNSNNNNNNQLHSGGSPNEDNADNENGTSRSSPDDDGASATPADLDRSANHSHHATRSTRALGGDQEKPPSLLAPFLPLAYPTTSADKKNGITAPPLPPLRSEEAEEDLLLIERLINSGPGAVDQRIIDDLCAPIGATTYGAAPTATASNVRASAVPMSAQSSAEEFSDPTPQQQLAITGGPGDETPMKREGEGSSMGGAGSTGMKRSASGAGLVGTDGGKRVRSR
ncbi:hypothetical protein FGG08_007467 [Glutinoglossum americanum]|uniref:Uncharacterized protein n=1 Tax=Glutinoglossum americanum TaxID=1670608 RepID=A0A9P8HTU9_9PEZI|nr:hypothetical protein FGG08_007467 [Glutinoglossum americanum]